VPYDPDQFLPLEVVLPTLCHELTQVWEWDHNDRFHLKGKALMDEIENDLGGRVKLRRDNPGSLTGYAEKHMLLRWEPKPNTRKQQPTGNMERARTTWQWENWFWSLSRYDGRKSNKYPGEPEAPGRTTEMKRKRDVTSTEREEVYTKPLKRARKQAGYKMGDDEFEEYVETLLPRWWRDLIRETRK
jgi:hypothetical protein